MITMTQNKDGEVIYYGQSTDTKPVGASKTSKFMEYDTGAVYVFDGTTWHLI